MKKDMIDKLITCDGVGKEEKRKILYAVLSSRDALLDVLKYTLSRLQYHTNHESCDLPQGTRLAIEQAEDAIVNAKI